MKAVILNASAWMIVPFMDAIAKYLSSSMDVLQITWARYFFTVILALSIMLLFDRKSLVWSKKPVLQLIRGLIFVFSTYLFFFAISEISLPKALTLAFVAPICVTAMSPFFLNEKVGIISSMNLHQGSVTNSLEIGVRITNIAERKNIENIIHGYFLDEETEDFRTGYCIKTKSAIDYNVKKPIDKSQFSPNDMNNNMKYCHSCGNETETTVAEPLCDGCK